MISVSTRVYMYGNFDFNRPQLLNNYQFTSPYNS